MISKGWFINYVARFSILLKKDKNKAVKLKKTQRYK